MKTSIALLPILSVAFFPAFGAAPPSPADAANFRTSLTVQQANPRHAAAGVTDATSATNDSGVTFSESVPAYSATDGSTIVGLAFFQDLASGSSGPRSSLLAGIQLFGAAHSVVYEGVCEPSGTSVITFRAAGIAGDSHGIA